MYAVVTTGGKQYRVEAGSELLVEKLGVDPGASVTFDRVLLIGDGDDVTVGTPLVAGASVTGTVLRAERGPKIIIFKFKQKAKYRRRTGHRQDFVRVRIDEISASGKRAKAEPTPAEEPKAAAKPEAGAPKKGATKRSAATPKASASKAAGEEKPKRATRAKASKADAKAAPAEKPKPKRASRAKAKE